MVQFDAGLVGGVAGDATALALEGALATAESADEATVALEISAGADTISLSSFLMEEPETLAHLRGQGGAVAALAASITKPFELEKTLQGLKKPDSFWKNLKEYGSAYGPLASPGLAVALAEKLHIDPMVMGALPVIIRAFFLEAKVDGKEIKGFQKVLGSVVFDLTPKKRTVVRQQVG